MWISDGKFSNALVCAMETDAVATMLGSGWLRRVGASRNSQADNGVSHSRRVMLYNTFRAQGKVFMLSVDDESDGPASLQHSVPPNGVNAILSSSHTEVKKKSGSTHFSPTCDNAKQESLETKES